MQLSVAVNVCFCHFVAEYVNSVVSFFLKKDGFFYQNAQFPQSLHIQENVAVRIECKRLKYGMFFVWHYLLLS